MLTKRIIPCLDVINGRVTKGVKFQNNVDLGDPEVLARKYYDEGADELVVYDITASAEKREIDLDMVRRIAACIHIPFAVGGGVASLSDMQRVLEAGAEKVSINSLALARPTIITDGAKAFGRQCMVLGMDPVRNDNRDLFPSGYEVTAFGCRQHTGLDALVWARQAEDMGIGEIVVNSVDRDGTCSGFELEITRLIVEAVRVPVVASGGAGKPDDIVDVFQQSHVDAAIIAGILHRGEYTIPAIKSVMHAKDIAIRSF